MTKLKDFFDKRTVGLGKKVTITKEKSQEEKVIIKKKFLKNFKNLELKENYLEEDLVIPNNNKNSDNLSDEEFWDISNNFLKKTQKTNSSHADILEEILDEYTPHKIRQFAKRYEELNH